MKNKIVSEETLHKRELNKLKVKELVHWWCNNKIKIEYIRGRYTFTPDKFYLNDVQKAQVINKKYLALVKFDNSGSYNNGLDFYYLMNCFPVIPNVILFKNSPFHLLNKKYKKKIKI